MSILNKKTNLRGLHIFSTFLLLMFHSCVPNEEVSDMNEDYIEIPDLHFESYLIEKGFDSDGILNGSISVEDAEQITQIRLEQTSSGKVESLQGIESFKNLEALVVYNQNISEINLTNSRKLDTIILEANHLTQLDLSGNRNVKFVNVASNELTDITGVTNLRELRYLNLSYNLFSEITVDNTNLKALIMTNNPLTSIDLAGIPELETLLLQSNQLTNVDSSKNKKLITLILSDNPLETMDLSHNSALSYFYASSTLLNYLDVSNNTDLVDLRVHQNPNLTCIKIDSNQHILTTVLSDYQELNESCNEVI